MKILQICQKPPSPAVDGGCLASLQLSLEIMGAGFDLDVVAISTHKHPFRKREADKAFLKSTNFKTKYINTRFNPWQLIKNIFSSKSIWEDRFYKKSFERFLIRVLKENTYDIVIFDGLMTTFYLDAVKTNSEATVIYRSHNIEFTIPKQRADNSKDSLKKWYLKQQADRLEVYERNIWLAVTYIFSISFWDTKFIIDYSEARSGVMTHYFGIALRSNGHDPEPNSVFHLGSMDWEPNTAGVSWLVNDVWPIVLEKLPEAQLHLGGRNIRSRFKSEPDHHIHVHKKVPDSKSFMDAYDVMVVPVKTGSGTRIKVLEGMASGKVIVSTEKGIEGIACQHESDVLLADDPAAFADQIIRALTDRELKQKLSKGAREIISRQYLPERNTEKIKQLLTVVYDQGS